MKSTLTVAVTLFLIGIMLVPQVKSQPAPSTGWPPADVRAAYDVTPLINSGYTGNGVTVAVIGTDGPGQTFNADLAEFNRRYGLPATNLSVVQPWGPGGNNTTEEITADAEFVHAMAPDARILLVLTGSHEILDGYSYVIDHNAADIATMSFYSSYYDYTCGNGWAESKMQDWNNEYSKSVEKKITLVTSSGDFGSNNTVPWLPSGTWTGDFWTKHLPCVYMLPNYSPYVTVVGGTVLTIQYAGSPYSETGWSQSGGGPSNLFPEPIWQTGRSVPQNYHRNIPDLALDASCQTPYAYYWNLSQGGGFCGTSAAAPTFAGIIADIEQAAGGRLGFLNPTLYSLASLDPSVYHEITSGCSLLQPSPNATTTTAGYCAHSGWDFVTGWGSVDAVKLAKHLAPNAPVVQAQTTTITNLQTVPTNPQTTNPQLSTSTIPLTTTAVSTSMIILGLSVIALPFIGIIGLIVFVVRRRRRKGKRTGGTAAEGLASRPSPAPVPTAEGTKFCTACGVRIPVTARFCASCGGKQD